LHREGFKNYPFPELAMNVSVSWRKVPDAGRFRRGETAGNQFPKSERGGGVVLKGTGVCGFRGGWKRGKRSNPKVHSYKKAEEYTAKAEPAQERVGK